ncbi:nuclear transport factor 2 family protein [Spirosoma taeanense]|uniref:Nuclear transport factor 2 family protein n=1 Tax=Spirosoma taeanense TaxID=2735870 RepID=A0A6M5Y8D4_9BACT|nr:DUF4440 domain-containing protein [Spirosoma taeanense]QJW90225.1 nuclear transport factor 2 family protein [Spirosoma taeanense]
MKANLFLQFRRSLLALVWVATLTLGLTARAQNTTSADEQAIRNLVAQQNNGQRIPYTSEGIFWSGAYPRPVRIGKPETEDEKAINERMRKRTNQKSAFNIDRLVIAQSGDIAYEYGTGSLSFDDADNKHVSHETGYLRTWRKQNGEWKVDLMFIRPMDSGMTAFKK